MNDLLVSIIIPVYNSEKYLRQCIDSCLKQTYENIEIILIDDGSIDSSLRICQEYANKDNRVKVMHQNNSGVSSARNKGLQKASGEYVFFLDSDDEICQNSIEFLVSDIKKYKADIVSAVYSTVDYLGNEHCRYNDGQIKIYTGQEPLIQSLKYDRQTNSAWAKLFSKDILQGVLFEEGRHIHEDGYFIFQCYAKKPKLVQHNEIVYKYYRRESSSTRGEFSEKYFDMIYFSDLKMKFIQNNHPTLIELAKDMEVSTNLFLLEVLCRDVDDVYKDETKKSISIIRRRYFKYKTINKHERKMATIVAFGLYPIYKNLFIAKYMNNKKCEKI